jgi:small-conductance mechanosensitive channel/CRP-like cAMP-binding protein
MPDFSTIWNTIAHIVVPLLWVVGGYFGLRILIHLGRNLRVISGLTIVGQLYPLLVGVLLGLWRANLMTAWLFPTRVILTFVAIFTVALLLHIGDRLLVRRLEAQGRPNTIPRLMRDIARGVLLVITFFVSISQFFQIQIGTVLLSSTVFTAVVGLALQDLLKNVFAGIALQLERPFAPGDWIFIDQQLGFGRVLEMSWRAIRVRPRDGQVVVIPNSVVSQQQITNLSATGRPIAMRLRVTLDAAHPPNVIRDLLKKAVLSSDGVLDTPAPYVYSRDYTSATAVYEIKFWVANYDNYPEQQADALGRIWYVLQRADVKFAPNEMVITRPQALQTARRVYYTPDQILKRLRRIALLNDVLSEDELRSLCGQVEIRLFAAGEVMARQGQFETTLYAITSGRARVEVQQDAAEPLVLSHLGSGEIFGERGLLMGEPRSASVIAEEDTRTIVIDRHDILPIFEHNPMLPERLGEILTQRQSATSAYLEEHQRAASNQAPTISPNARSVAERIRRVLFDLGK